MNQQILEDLKLACEPEQETTSRLYIVNLLQKFFQTKKYYDRQWEEEKFHFNLSIETSKKLAANYSQLELEEAFAKFEEGQLEFALLRLAKNLQAGRQNQRS
jgi:hypothetical protein